MILFEISILTLFSPKYKVYCGYENGKSYYADSCEKCPQEESKCGSSRVSSCQWTNQKCIIDESESFIFD